MDPTKKDAVTEAAKQLVESLTEILPNDTSVSTLIAEGIQDIVDEIRAQVEASHETDHVATQERITRLESQRDEAISLREQAELTLESEREAFAVRLETQIQAITDKCNAKIQEAMERVREMEKEKDDLVSSLTEEYEGLRQSDRETIIAKVGEVIEAKVSAQVEKQLTENTCGLSVADAPLAALGQRITEMVLDHVGRASGEQIESVQAQRLTEDITAANARIRQLEVRTTTLTAESSMYRKKYNQLLSEANGGTSATDEPKADAGDTTPLNESTDGQPANGVKPQAEDKSGSRAVSFLREALGSEGRSRCVESTDGLAETRQQRQDLAKVTAGKGVIVRPEDIIRETTETKANNQPAVKDGDKLVPGSTTSRSDAQVLAGIR